MAGRRKRIRYLRATKAQIASQLQSISPGLTGNQIVDIKRSDDSTFWYAMISSGYGPLLNIEEKLDTFVEFDANFLIENLISLIDNTITANQIDDIRIAPDDATKIEVILKKVLL